MQKERKNKMKIKILNIDNNKSETINVSDKLINLKVNHKLIKYVIDWQLNHSKPRVAKTKQRNEVIGSTKKIYAQIRNYWNFKGKRPSIFLVGNLQWLFQKENGSFWISGY